MTAQNVAFGLVAVVIAVAAIKVVTTQNIFHAAMYLALVLAGVAAIYVLAIAEFTAVVQVLVYIGAIIVLFLFGITLTQAPIGRGSDLDNDQRWLALLVALLLLGTLSWVLLDHYQDTEITLPEPATQSAARVGDSIFSTFVVPFEVISVLLLAALIGAIALARRD